MKHIHIWLKGGDVILKYIERECCMGCGAANPKHWAFPSIYRGVVSLMPACQTCAMVDAAHKEADELEIRYTEIGVGPDQDQATHYNGSRCICGAVSLAFNSYAHCVRCWRDERMLGKKKAEHRLLRRLLADLRKTVREVKKTELEAVI